MALKKEIINGKGVKTTYHRIDSISMVNGIKVTVKSYTDDEEMAKTGDEYDKEKVIALTEEINEIGFPVALDLAIFIHTFEYPLDRDAVVSYEAMYEKLKQEPIFEGAKDVSEE